MRPARKPLSFPLNQRPVIAGWKLLFLRSDVPAGSHEERRMEPRRLSGRGPRPLRRLPYAAQCARRRARQRPVRRRRGRYWHAYALNDNSPAPVAVGRGRAIPYLRHGRHADHGAAPGRCGIVSNLAWVADTDVRAIATYTANALGAPSPDRKRPAEAALPQANRRQRRPGAPVRRSMPPPAPPVMKRPGRRRLAASTLRSARPSPGRPARRVNIVLTA